MYNLLKSLLKYLNQYLENIKILMILFVFIINNLN